MSRSIPAAYAELAGAGHLTVLGDAGGFRGPATAWALWQLTGDTVASGLFLGADCGLCTSSDWSEYEANAQLESAGGGEPSTPPEGEQPPPAEDDGNWWDDLFGWLGIPAARADTESVA